MIYYVLNSKDSTFVVKNSANAVGTYLLGKCISNITIIKMDQDGNRVYTPTDGDVFKIQKELEDL